MAGNRISIFPPAQSSVYRMFPVQQFALVWRDIFALHALPFWTGCGYRGKFPFHFLSLFSIINIVVGVNGNYVVMEQNDIIY